jgi:hypothetical protein
MSEQPRPYVRSGSGSRSVGRSVNSASTASADQAIQATVDPAAAHLSVENALTASETLDSNGMSADTSPTRMQPTSQSSLRVTQLTPFTRPPSHRSDYSSSSRSSSAVRLEARLTVRYEEERAQRAEDNAQQAAEIAGIRETMAAILAQLQSKGSESPDVGADKTTQPLDED